MHKVLISVFIYAGCSIVVRSQPDVMYNTYGNVANFFTSVEEMSSFFDFKNGDVVAEVGAGTGKNIGGFGLMTDSCVFYIQDVDPAVMNKAHWNSIYRKCKKKGMSSKHQFNLVVGEFEKTLLPEASFDKIIMVSAFHEFNHMKEMIADIKTRLKPNGMVYILESKCFVHQYFPADEIISMWKEQGFELKQRIERDLNDSEGLYILSFTR